MSKQGDATNRLPVVDVHLRGGQIRYGQQIQASDRKLAFTRISPSNLSELINSRIQRRRFASVTLVLAVLIPASLVGFDYLSNSEVLPSTWVLVIAVGAVGLLIAYGLGQLEAKARTTTLNYKLDKASKQNFLPLHTAITQAINSERIWSIHAETHTSDWKRQAGASSLVARNLVSTKNPPLFLKTDFPVLSITHGQNMSLFFFPDCLYLYQQGIYTLFEYDGCKIIAEPTSFIEDGAAPGDAQKVGTTWRYVKRDGGPDQRFKDNRQLPIMQYCSVTLTLAPGMDLEFHISNLENGRNFAAALSNYNPIEP